MGPAATTHLPFQISVDYLVRVFGEAAEFVLSNPEVFVAFVLWQLVLLYTVPVLFWDFELGVYWLRNWQNRRNRDRQTEWGLDALQVRIVTIDNAAVVQETVDSLPDGVEDIVVVAERPIDVEKETDWQVFGGTAGENSIRIDGTRYQTYPGFRSGFRAFLDE
ncbi:hypothetical protein [Halobaculum limi]|uniref:hypothetical protein n=1 Tax=Halobaculum limi TaxID=3031916 RepID=UPI0024061E72|nr:hypothetical protein [Halobaculum sp. YSMS11]